ncbi:MAG: oxidoreductase [Candidatus Bathyarchaeota archaeon]
MKTKWTVHDIPDLTWKKIIVTGGNSGLGFESVKAFAAKGAEVILASKSKERGDAAKKIILSDQPNSKIKVMTLDLADLKSIHEFITSYKEQYKRLDVLLNNAGVMMTPYSKTKDGFEMQLGINYLGHFALTGLLLDVLKKTTKSRVVNISSSAHRYGKMDFNNLMYEKGGYSPMRAYGRSKLANLLFTYELQRRFERAGMNYISVAAHPGLANTNLGRYLNKIVSKILFTLLRAQSAAMGALPGIRAAVNPNVTGGQYFGPSGFMEQRGYPITIKSNNASHNEADARQLWDVSEQLTSVRFITS